MRNSALGVLVVLLASTPAVAEPVRISAVMKPKEQIRADLPTQQKHFVLFVRREGQASGSGALNGAQLTEYGMHDIRPGQDGSPRGYLVAKLPSGDQAVIQWEVQATFIPDPDGKPMLLDNGLWRLIGGTRSFEAARGAGILHIKAVSDKDREFQLEGEVAGIKR
jgi:hypothetical protein